jgi:hypothetical protein
MRLPASICLAAGGYFTIMPVPDMVAHVVGIGLIALTIVSVTIASRRPEAPHASASRSSQA